MANLVLVSNPDIPSPCSNRKPSTIQESSDNSRVSPHTASTVQENDASYMSTIRKLLEGLGFTKRSIDVIIASWREGTASQYQIYLQKWFAFCQKRNCDVISPTLPMAVYFLSMLYEKGPSFSTLNTARSMLSSILQLNVISSLQCGQLPN